MKYVLMKICSLKICSHENLFVLLPENLVKTWIKVASGNGGLQNNYFLSCDLLINVTYFYAKMQNNFFCCTFLQFWAFLLMFVTILARDHMEFWFYFKYAYLEEHINILKKFCHLGTGLYYLWNIVFVEKLWTLIDYIPWCGRSRDNFNQTC